MADRKEEVQRYLSVVRGVGTDIQDIRKTYSEWSSTYDKDAAEMNYAGPWKAAAAVSSFFPDNRDSIRILDIGAGTGLVADELQKNGFTNIDALEPNEEMLVIAKRKNVYKQYYNVYVPEQGKTAVPSKSYDVITCSGSFGNGHLPCNVLNEFIRITKPDGLVVICTYPKYFTSVSEYRDRLMVMIVQYEKEGKWQKLEEEKIPNYVQERDGILLVFRITC